MVLPSWSMEIEKICKVASSFVTEADTSLYDLFLIVQSVLSMKFSVSILEKHLCKLVSLLLFPYINLFALKKDYENYSKSLRICFLCWLLNENNDVSQLSEILNNLRTNIAVKFYIALKNKMGSI